MGKTKQNIYKYLEQCLSEYLTHITDENYLGKITGFKLKDQTEPLTEEHQKQLTAFIAEIAEALPVDSHKLQKSQIKQRVIMALSELGVNLIPSDHQPLIEFYKKLTEFCGGKYPKTTDVIKNLQSAQIQQLSELLQKYDKSVETTESSDDFLKQLAKTASENKLPGCVLLPNPYNTSRIQEKDNSRQDKRYLGFIEQLLYEYLYKDCRNLERPPLKFNLSECSYGFQAALNIAFPLDKERFFTAEPEDAKRMLSQMDDTRILKVLQEIANFFLPTKTDWQKMPLICCSLDFLKENKFATLDVDSFAELMKLKFGRQFADELCYFSRLGQGIDTSVFREGKEKGQVAENTTPSLSLHRLKKVFRIGKFSNDYDTSSFELLMRGVLTEASADKLSRSASCHF